MPVTDQFLIRIAVLQEELNRALAELDLPETPRYLYDPIRYVNTGQGKRLRPILVRLTGEAFGANIADLLNAGLAVELLHNFTLVHDDIMDGDNQRHGQPTVHKKWDESTAILAGDGLFALSQLLLLKVSVNPLIALRRFNEATLVVCEGQGLDKEFETDSSITLDHYLFMIEKKTGNLIGLCAELGAILGNQSEATNQALFNYGLALGKAFQIHDDVLEITAEPEIMGKSLGSDIKAGKQTILTILAREKDAGNWGQFCASVDTSDETNLCLAYRNYFESTGVLDQAIAYAKQYGQQALDLLEVIPAKSRSVLIEFTDLVLNRKK